ncbi:putative jacalin-like lectin domain containing protein [Lyophyllum shimeji]|uniref:Jacalin-like lectin domain containing protein n=1 Tax=Lyophyllum shimeji TaxID=47721 RepID=A0A9P3UMR9_LYOSH|nr:putative jacalin-like lectin domain containing protein [Lyophyllum shimeji]
MTVSKSCFCRIGLSALILSAAAAQTQGSFSLLSYNVASLPEALSSGNPVVDTPFSPRLKPYNIIHMQEDFNYHAALYPNDTHCIPHANLRRSCVGSGLNTLSDFPYIDLDRVTWKDCNLNSGDCLTPKGFTFISDITASTSNFAQVSTYMQTWSVGMPIVVMGDTNSRYTRPGDSDTLHGLLSTNGLSDAWVMNVRGSSFPASGAPALGCDFPFAAGTTQAQMVACEVVDKILVRGSAFLTFEQTSFTNENDTFMNGIGKYSGLRVPIIAVCGRRR